jgi:hypothetical protein
MSTGPDDRFLGATRIRRPNSYRGDPAWGGAIGTGGDSDAFTGRSFYLSLFFATCVVLMADALVYRDGDGPGWKAA